MHGPLYVKFTDVTNCTNIYVSIRQKNFTETRKYNVTNSKTR